ncbi:MAG TPA: PDGLE domain-containing protein [Methanocorpusculum sp.]|nr:PDGLE domain-containing protein [Methanocorpusculum sp.]
MRPELAGNSEGKAVSLGKIAAVGLAAALVIGGCAVFFASANPDGLDSTILISEGNKELFSSATSDEIAGEEKDPVKWNAPMPDYALGDSNIGGVIALVIGIIVVLGLIFGAAVLARRSKEKKE